MPSFPSDRFDEFDDQLHRVGAHRAPKSRAGAWLTLLWAALATLALIAAGVVGLAAIQGGLDIENLPGLPGASEEPTASVAPEARAPYPRFDADVEIRVLNATPTVDLQLSVRDSLVATGWNVITVATASSTDFATTTVYYTDEQYEGAARGLAEALGGVPVAFDDETFVGLPLTVALGADYAPES